MQTFLPEMSFTASFRAFDNRRLGKQRVEAYQILRTLHNESDGWKNHPAVKMWRGHERALLAYTRSCCNEWIRRGFKDTILEKIKKYDKDDPNEVLIFNYPPWYNLEFCESHRSNLIRKFPKHYREFWPDTPDNLPYIWPVK